MAAKKKGLFPLELSPGEKAASIDDLVRVILDESDRQVEEKGLKDADAIEEFRMACVALNAWRMYLRFVEEIQSNELDEETLATFREMCRKLAKKRKYQDDDFQSALLATQERTRLPWGYNALRLAYGRTQRNPIRLLNRDLANAQLPTTIAGIAYELAQMQKDNKPILLPVENVRALLEQRKLVVGGALMRLMQAGLLEKTSKRHGTGRAREFKFRGELGKDFEFVKKTPFAEDGDRE